LTIAGGRTIMTNSFAPSSRCSLNRGNWQSWSSNI